jgi:hypothetical protein
VKYYFKKKREWEATLKVLLLEEKASMRTFCKNVLGPDREKCEQLAKDLDELDEGSLDPICRKYVQYCKDLHVLRTYHYNIDNQGTVLTTETLQGAAAFTRRALGELFYSYEEEDLKRFPASVETNVARGLMKRDGTKRRLRVKGEKGESNDGTAESKEKSRDAFSREA